MAEADGWSHAHVAAPSVITVADYTLLAYEGIADSGETGIGLALAVERRLETDSVDVDFHLAGPGEGMEPITLENYGLGAVHVASIRTAGPGFSVSAADGFDLDNGESRRVDIVFRTTVSGEYNGVLVIRSDSQVQPDRTIPLHAVVD